MATEPKNPMDDLIGDPQQPATPPEKPEPNPELETLKESVNNIGENLQTLTEKISGLEENLTQPPAETEPPTPPEKEGWWDENRAHPPTWKDLREEVETIADRKAEEKLKVKEEEAAKAYQTEEEHRQKIDQEFDRQIDEMEKQGLISPVKEPDNTDDPGRAERREIFGYAAKLGTLNLKEAGQTLKELHESGRQFDVKTGKIIKTRTSSPGQFVPVGSSSSQGAGGKTQIDYKTLHNTSMDELVRRSLE